VSSSAWSVKRSLWRFADDGGAGVALVHTHRFSAPVKLSGFELPRCWDSTGNERFLRSLRLMVIAPGGSEWNEVWSNEDLPARAPSTIRFQIIPALAARLEAWRIHPPARQPRASSLREDTVEPLSILDGNSAHGIFRWITEPMEDAARSSVIVPWQATVLPEIEIVPPSPGVAVFRHGDSVVMDNGWLRIGCSLERPRLTHLGWDQLGAGRQLDNLLASPEFPGSTMRHWTAGNGPVVVTPLWRSAPSRVSADKIQASGSRVTWKKVHLADGIALDASFALSSTSLEIELTLSVSNELIAVDAEAWRLNWNLQRTLVSHLAEIHQPFVNGRRGRCRFPAILHAPNYGSVRVEVETGDPTRNFLIVDSNLAACQSWCGIEVGVEPLANGDVRLQRGDHHIRLTLRRCEVVPAGAADLPAVRRSWASGFAFQPEGVGMSCTAVHSLAWFQMHQFADHARATDGPSGELMRSLTRYTLELGLRGAPGYGSQHWGFADTDSSISIAAGVLAEDAPAGWAETIWPRLREAGQRIRASQREGLVTCTAYTGNRGERRWSTNWWDTICFGHQDAYANALAWRGLKMLARVASRLGDRTEADACANAAAQLKQAYWPAFRHPESGLVSGWRSADGELHDYSFLFINGIAVYGLVPHNSKIALVHRIEEERMKTGFSSARFGLPGNLRPIPAAECARGHGDEDGFGRFQNGGITACMAYHWVRAMGMTGCAGVRGIEDELLAGFEDRLFGCGINDYSEFRCRDGVPCGIVGMLTDQFYVLLAILQNRGMVPPLLLE